jgi:hypothetical protein
LYETIPGGKTSKQRETKIMLQQERMERDWGEKVGEG